MTELVEQKWLSAKELSQRFGVNVTTIWRWSAKGILPPPGKLGTASRWDRAMIHALEERLSRGESLSRGEKLTPQKLSSKG